MPSADAVSVVMSAVVHLSVREEFIPLVNPPVPESVVEIVRVSVFVSVMPFTAILGMDNGIEPPIV